MGKSTRYILVHQSGHVDTWCNCTTHMRIAGDSTGTAPIKLLKDGAIVRIEFSKCDCEYWSQWNIPKEEPDEPNMVAKGAKECIRGRKDPARSTQ